MDLKQYKLGLVAALIIFCGINALAQPLKDISPGVNGTVNTIARYGNSMIVGGSFTLAGTSAGGDVKVSGSNVVKTFPRISGEIFTSASDGNGGWYLGGNFSKIGTDTFYNAVHVKSDNSIDMNWIPVVNGTVRTLSLQGDYIYIGGTFTSVNGVTRNNIARVDKSTGAIDSDWDPSANNDVFCIATYSGGLIVGGKFTNIGNASRNHIAKFSDASDDADPTWNPNANGSVRSIIKIDTNIYASGEFDQIDGKNIAYLCKIGFVSGIANISWNPKPDYYVYSIAADATDLYFVGTFTKVGLITRNRAAKVSLSSGSLDPNWNPSADNIILSVAVNSNYVFLAGYFEFLGISQRSGMARVYKTSGQTDENWVPNVGTQFNRVEAVDTNIVFGGSNLLMDASTRNNIAAFDMDDGTLTSFDPDADGPVNSIVISGNNLYAGGWFSFIGGDTRFFLAKLNASTGLVDDNFMPDVNDGVNVVKVFNDKLYVGGWFSLIDGWARKKIARLDTASGSVDLNWDAKVITASGSFRVNDILPTSNGIYLAGKFDSLDNAKHRSIAKVNLTNGNSYTSFHPQITGEVFSITTIKGKLFAGGDFTAVNDTAYSNLVVMDTSNGNPTYTFKPQFNNNVYSIAAYDTLAFVGGSFDQLDGSPANYLAKINPTTLTRDTSGTFYVDNYINSIYSFSGTLALGGTFGEVKGSPHNGLSVFGGSSEIKIPLKKGWNLISSNVMADNMAVTSLLSDIVDNVVLMKNVRGKNYIPSFNINTIGDWDISQAYQTYLTASDTLVMNGTLVSATTPIIMPYGWSWVAYLRTTPKSIVECLSTLTDRSTLVLAKDINGKNYIPSFNINTIGNMMPGSGYQMFVTALDTLIYPANDASKQGLPDELTPSPLYLKPVATGTGNSSVVLFNIAGQDKNEVGAYNSDSVLIGSGIVNNGYAAVTIWGDDKQTDIADGARYDEKITFKLLNVSDMSFLPINLTNVKNVITGSDGLNEIDYNPDSFIMAKAQVIDTKFDKMSVFPNPAKDFITVHYYNQVTQNIKISIYSIDGKKVAQLENVLQTKGNLDKTYSIALLPAGTYLLIIETPDQKEIQTFIKK